MGRRTSAGRPTVPSGAVAALLERLDHQERDDRVGDSRKDGCRQRCSHQGEWLVDLVRDRVEQVQVDVHADRHADDRRGIDPEPVPVRRIRSLGIQAADADPPPAQQEVVDDLDPAQRREEDADVGDERPEVARRPSRGRRSR